MLDHRSRLHWHGFVLGLTKKPEEVLEVQPEVQPEPVSTSSLVLHVSYLFISYLGKRDDCCR